VTTLVKGKSIAVAEKISNSEIAKELDLPPVKIHCSVLAEDAIKAAIKNFKEKNKKDTTG
jgi:nitrogen fixation NifU-like protein